MPEPMELQRPEEEEEDLEEDLEESNKVTGEPGQRDVLEASEENI